MFYNPETNSGYLSAKLKNINSKITKLNNSGTKKRKLDTENENAVDNIISTEDLQFFQNCVVAEQLEEIKDKLRQTVKSRTKFCDTEANVLHHFPIFIFDSTLVMHFKSLIILFIYI